MYIPLMCSNSGNHTAHVCTNYKNARITVIPHRVVFYILHIRYYNRGYVKITLIKQLGEGTFG